MGQYLHHYETENAFNAAYNGEDYIEPWVSYTNETEGEEHVDYNKRYLVLEFDTQVTENVMYSNLDDSWSSSTAAPLYPVAGGNVQGFLNALDEGIDIKYIVHNYNGGDAVFYGDMLNGGTPKDMDQSVFGLSCPYGLMASMFKETGTDKLYLFIDCLDG